MWYVCVPSTELVRSADVQCDGVHRDSVSWPIVSCLLQEGGETAFPQGSKWVDSDVKEVRGYDSTDIDSVAQQTCRAVCTFALFGFSRT